MLDQLIYIGMRYILLFMVVIIQLYKGETIIINAGVSGNNTYDLLNRIETDVLNKKPDLVILMIGTNDMVNSGKMISYQEYSDNLNRISQVLKGSKIEVLLMSPPPIDTVFLFERHRKEIFNEPPNVKIDSVRTIMKGIAKKYDFFFIDIFESFRSKNIPAHNEDYYIRNPKNSGARDGVHPTGDGYKLIATTIFNFMKENKLLFKNVRVVCFGDSITFGAYTKGAGTTKGETYPAYLLTMINDR